MLLVTLAEIRDVVVIVYGIAGVLLMLALAIAALGIWFAIRALTRSVNEIVNDNVKRTIEDVQRTVANVRGTSEFMADQAVSPIIRAQATARGVKRGINALTGIRNIRK